jgi:hypothetical protein
VNIKRSPLCARNFEYLSEDPLVSGVLGAAFVRSLQAGGVGASVEHFTASNQETDRMRVSSDVDERTLREIYFHDFERVVREAQPVVSDWGATGRKLLRARRTSRDALRGARSCVRDEGSFDIHVESENYMSACWGSQSVWLFTGDP